MIEQGNPYRNSDLNRVSVKISKKLSKPDCPENAVAFIGSKFDAQEWIRINLGDMSNRPHTIRPAIQELSIGNSNLEALKEAIEENLKSIKKGTRKDIILRKIASEIIYVVYESKLQLGRNTPQFRLNQR